MHEEAKAQEAISKYDSQAAIDLLRSAVKSDSHFVRAWVELGNLLVPLNLDDGLAAFHNAVAINSGPETLNAVAFSLADADEGVAEALEYARTAVDEEEQASTKIELDHLRIEDIRHTQRLGQYWDTLGWTYFRSGKLDESERYLRAAWFLSQDGSIGDHLGQLYEKKSDRQAAIRTYQLALGAASNAAGGRPVMLQTQARLDRLIAVEPAIVKDKVVDLGSMRTAHVERLVPGSATATFFLVFTAGPKVEGVRFISGSEELRSAGSALRSAKFDFPFPDDGPTRVLRRGLLMCFPTTGCSLVLVTPNSVASVN